MNQHVEINYDGIDKNEEYEKIITKVMNECFENEGLDKLKLYVSITLTVPEKIQEINKKYRNIDRATDVLSFPMLDYPNKKCFKDFYIDYNFDETFLDGDELVLGDIVLSLERALEQSEEYNHSYKREVSYLVVHSILHLLGYDHMEENDRIKMRAREEYFLSKLGLERE